MKMRHFLMANIFLIILYISAITVRAQELTQVVKKVSPATVTILTYDKNGEIIGQGSGFFISKDGDIITNRHVLTDAHRADIKTANGKVYHIAKIVAENKEADIVRAKVNIPESVHYLSLIYSSPEVGERIVVVGNPLGLEQTVSDGIVSAIREIPKFGKIYQITAPVSSGSSGSPVVNIKGEVIGVATFQLVEGQNLNFAIPSEYISKLRVEKDKTFEEWAKGNVEEWITSAGGLYSSGLFFLWSYDYEKALPYFEEAVKKDPNYADAYFYIGYCNRKLGRYTEAIEAYKQAIRIKPDYAEAHYNLGVAYDDLGRYTEAIEAFKQAIRIKPDDAEAHYNLGVTYGNLGRYTEAIEAYKQAIRIKPDDAEAHHNLGVTYGDLGRYTEAIEAFKQAIRIKPDYAEAHYNLGVTYLIVSDKGSALDEYKILKDLNTDLANKLFNLIYE